MRSALAFAFAAVGVVVATGCGSTVNEDDEASSGSGASGASGSSGPSGPGGSGGATSSSGAGGAGPCPEFFDEQGSGDVTVRFRNESPQTIYLPGTCTTVDYHIRPDSGDDGISYTYDGSCLQTCEALQTTSAFDCGACAPLAFELPAGGSLEVVWKGNGLEGAAMPAECYFDDVSSGTCSRIVAAPPNTYRVEAFGFGTCDGESPGVCECDSTGKCNGTPSGQQAGADVSKFAHPGSASVEVVFGPCAFGCPGG